ncbi:coiled-coil domain-containing protein 87 [Balaenoptera acutorostrata]|uniref:Coiled-coil domain-containing protein 87 n=1 Tax=Balaenoptera acutorostrata TaxID=9767 RepID=A0ABM3U3E1_BALAC|nr:coiled-coil domain-containing protein 87 [Balaenoptera acutorostrata]XP_057408864.1 coiled-coil domain-containing protein 87 [Balaenoptera acutorostrata]
MEPYKPEPELQRFYHRLLRPLSLFARTTTRTESQKRLPQEVPMLLPLPVSRLTVASLCRQVAERLANSGLEARAPRKVRLRFTEVILDELKCSWQEPPTEPGLSHLNNQRLRKRLLVYVLLSSEQLFVRYLHLQKIMSTPAAVFTESATLTRLAASLARDCTVFLTGPEVYRGLLADFRALLKEGQVQVCVPRVRPLGPTGAFRLCPIPWHHSTGFAQVPYFNLSLNYLIQLSRPREFVSEPEPDPVKELKSIPQLKKKKPLRWLSTMQKRRESNFNSQIASLPGSSVAPPSQAPPTSHLPLSSQLQRGQSMPSLREGWKLADELGLPPFSPRPLTPLVLVAESKPELEGDTVAEDLKQRMKNMHLGWSHYSPLDSGLPPLLGALTYRPAAKHHMEELQRMLKGLEEKEASEQWSLQPPRCPPLEPQPVTVTLKLRNQVVQAAAVQVSARNFLDSFHVEGAGVLYNHLAGELEPKLIEEMDTDRTFGSSIGEVYKELMSCVSNDHFSFDQGPLVEPAANEDWSAFLSSAFLCQEKQRRNINTKLAGLYSQRANTLQSNPDKMSSLTSLQASKSWEKWSNKASWLNWWKTTLSVGDYFKYLTTQQTDFLHVIFQIYEEEVPVEIVAPVRESLKIQHPPPLLEDNEPDFVPGEWDWDTVLECRLGTKNNSLLEDSHKILSLQKRLERLWSMLEVPDKDRLDMAIKYSSNARLRQLPSLVSAWERALQPIQLREILLGRLECFERQASDPNRFFHKTDMGLSRFLEENQIRNHLHKRLSLVEAPLVPLLEEIELVFGEPVTFKGQHYLDKMKHDKVEMLYWLQQRRRVRHLVRAKRASHQSALSRKLSSQPLVAPGNTPLLFDQTKCPQIPPSPPYTQQLTQTS